MGIKKINLLYIATSITGGGGVARILSQKTAAFVQAGYEVQVVSTNDLSDRPFYNFDPRVRFILYSQPIRTIVQLKQYCTFIQQKVIDVNRPTFIFVIDNGVKGYFIPYFLGNRIPVYFEVHGSRNFLLSPIQSPLKRWIVDRLTLALSKRFHGLILLNKQSAKDWTHNKLTVIPNWIENQGNRPVLAVKKQRQVIAIGRIVPEKNYEAMLAIWAKVQLEQPDWTLVICGGGPAAYVAELKEKAGAGVIWKGEIKNVDQEIQQSAFMLHTSNMEGMPMAFLEAMALGVAVVAFDVDFGPADLIEHAYNGYLVPQGDQEQMIDCCLALIKDSNKAEQFGAHAVQTVQQYDKSVVLPQWITFFESQD
ncbi:glycosyltransferase [Myroides sp. DF42-4-2]|uniref:glycosyltransferase n=1 Tax=unclassified Myroides TaxID=2642485 RepID=UPI00257766F2|nr:glycosyltransferase [Myroides sp. DF42-4-2]MDM1408863.1 glycosyltransferase [Myroides sp. DF42-4-2]